MEALSDYLSSRRRLVDWAIDRYLPSPMVEPKAIHDCMRYSATGGKRLRPILALAVAEMLGCPAARMLPTCVAVELIHTHSLILDDMPCMDNDSRRRGRLSSHALFGESVALLAADALLNLAISLLGSNHRMSGLSPENALEIIREVGESVGTGGVIGGQAADLLFGRTAQGPAVLERIHLAKTANLFRLSARAGAIVAGAGIRELGTITAYAENLGLAFQIVDDILDQAGAAGRTDPTEKDEPNYAVAYGAADARSMAKGATQLALAALSMFDERGETLRQLARHNLSRAS